MALAVFADYSKVFATTDFDINVSCIILSFPLIFKILVHIFSSNLSDILETRPHGLNIRVESQDKITKIAKLQDLLQSWTKPNVTPKNLLLYFHCPLFPQFNVADSW